MAVEFQFDSELHRYVVDNCLQPHVTGILEHYGVVDYKGVPWYTLARKTLLGDLVHRVTHFTDGLGTSFDYALQATVDEHEPQMKEFGLSDSALVPYCRAWYRFLEESDFECFPGHCEMRHVAEVNGMRYGMTIDRAGRLRKRGTILDLKCTASIEKAWPIQLAAYALGLPKYDGVVRWERGNVWLHDDGKYSYLPGGRRITDRETERRDEEVFLAALRLTYWKRENS